MDMDKLALMRSDQLEAMAMETEKKDPDQGDIGWLIKMQSAKFQKLVTSFFEDL